MGIKIILENKQEVNKEDYKEEIDNFIKKYGWIGFGYKSVAKPSAWNKGKVLMDIACDMNIVEPYVYGRGKGQYRTINDIEIEDVINQLQKNQKARDFALKYVKKI